MVTGKHGRPSVIYIYIYICIQVRSPRPSAQPTGTGLVLMKGVVHILSVRRNVLSVCLLFLLKHFFSVSVVFLLRFLTVSLSFRSPAFPFRFFLFLFRFFPYILIFNDTVVQLVTVSLPFPKTFPYRILPFLYRFFATSVSVSSPFPPALLFRFQQTTKKRKRNDRSVSSNTKCILYCIVLCTLAKTNLAHG
jgi:hypothetical protein